MANVIARMGRPAIVFAPTRRWRRSCIRSSANSSRECGRVFRVYYDYYQPEAYVPQRDLFIEKDSSINEHIEQMRLSCTKSLMERRDVVIVATVSAIYGIGNPNEYHQMILTLRQGPRLAARHHRPPDPDAVHPQRSRFRPRHFRVRGDTLDIFPAENAELAVRLTCSTTNWNRSSCSTR
jgi:excinuclease ABC subunit B